jgi:hypothetical protein
MKKLLRYLIISLVVLLVASSRWLTTREAPPLFLEAVEGDQLCLPSETPWAPRGSKALIIVTSPLCSACQASLDFTAEIDSYASSHGLTVHYVLGQRKELDLGANAMRASGKQVNRVSLSDFGVMVEPTYLRLDSAGRIESRWAGTVPTEEHDLVLQSVVLGEGLIQYKTMSASEALRYTKAGDRQVLALSSRGALPGAKVIALDELNIRCQYELNREDTTIVDCASAAMAWDCQAAALKLKKWHFRNVIAAGLPLRANACKSSANQSP